MPSHPTHDDEEDLTLPGEGDESVGLSESGDESDGGETDGGRRSRPTRPLPLAPSPAVAPRRRRPAPPQLIAPLAIGLSLASGLILLLLRRRRSPAPQRTHRRRGAGAGTTTTTGQHQAAAATTIPSISAAAATAWIVPPGAEDPLLDPAAAVSGPLAGRRLVFSPAAAAHPALLALAGAGAAVLGSCPDDDASPGPMAAEGEEGTPNPGAPAGGAPLAGPGARAVAAVAARAADLALLPSPPTSLPCALAAACGLAALRTPTATLAARTLKELTAGAIASGLARPSPARPSNPVAIIFGADLFAGCGGHPARVAALPVAARKAADAWASEAAVHPGAVTNFLSTRCPAVVAGGLVSEEEWESGAVLRGLRRAASHLAGEGDAGTEGQGSPEAARAAADQAASAMADIVSDGDLLLVPSLPGPHPAGGPGDAAAAARAAWAAGTRGLATLSGMSGLVALSIPIPPTGPSHAFPAGVTLLGGVGSEGAVLAAGAGVARVLIPAFAAALEEVEASLAGAAADGLLPAAPGAGSPSSSSASAATAHRAAPAPPASTSPGQAPVRAEATAAARTAATLRAGGNAAFREGAWEAAVEAYTAAAAADPSCHLALSNRSAALLNLMRFKAAAEDATASLKLATTAKALLRRAAARRGLGDGAGARTDLRAVLQLEPGNAQARSDMKALADAEAAGLL